MNRLLLLFSLLISQICFSQIIVKGKISDKLTKEELIGANVVWKTQNIGVSTDFNGKFEITIPSENFPVKLTVSYMGYSTQIINIKKEEWQKKNGFYNIYLKSDNKLIKEVKIVDSRLTQKQKESPLTIEAMDILAIKETPSVNFYDGLGALKGVDITAASLGFKIINTRGFNSTSPVRSLQIIDGVDNQAPGMNFSLGNFLGASELDILKVEIIQGASSAYFGPNAFNGVIKMNTKNPFQHQGLSVQQKFGSRNLSESIIRLAEKFKDKNGEDIFAYKINFSYMKAHDWEADNMAQVDGTEADINNPGGYDAVNRYGDEDTDGDLNDLRDIDADDYKDFGGLGVFYRTGYMEKDIVDYNTNNLKFSSSLHYKIKPDIEMMYKFNYGTGTTVYQGDNRFSLKNIQFFQNIMEIKKEDQFFVRAYRSKEDAGNSYDAVFTAIKLQEHNLISNQDWYTSYKNNWKNNFSLEDIGWSNFETTIISSFPYVAEYTFNGEIIELVDWINLTDSVLNANAEEIIALHDLTRYQTDLETNRLIPGTEEFENALNDITSKIPIEGGTGFYDKSALNHLHAEYQLHPKFADIKIGANFRLYSPDSKGSIFMDTDSTKISNTEYGIYSGFEKDLYFDKLKVNGTFRMDKNENFDFNFSPAASLVYKVTETDIIRLSFSSAIRNPTLSDQYLFYNVGRAILIGNLNGHGVDYGENLVTVQSLINYYLPRLEHRSQDSLKFFSVDPIRPEKAKSAELGFRTTLFDRVYIDANYYYSEYTDFIGYKVGVKYLSDTSNGGYNISLPSIQAYRMAANAENIVTTQGASIGLNYFISPQFTFNGNYSWNKLNEKGTEDPIIPAYNTPEHKYNLGFSGRDLHFSSEHMIFRNFAFNINYKWVEGFKYEGSPQFTGDVPTYDLLDMQISKKIPKYSATLKLGSSNLLNNFHYEVYGGPFIGRMTYLSILFEFK
ncbi:MAG: TonB-dependent receptor [Flavobacteriales bacterium]|jgi:iron complex outermembrane recepter protein|nr:TonB-dependent receptor [Flavobacteriales bacterium]